MAACSEEGYFQGVYEAEVCLQRGIIEALDREDGRLRGDDSFSSILVGEAGADYGLVYPGPSLSPFFNHYVFLFYCYFCPYLLLLLLPLSLFLKMRTTMEACLPYGYLV